MSNSDLIPGDSANINPDDQTPIDQFLRQIEEGAASSLPQPHMPTNNDLNNILNEELPKWQFNLQRAQAHAKARAEQAQHAQQNFRDMYNFGDAIDGLTRFYAHNMLDETTFMRAREAMIHAIEAINATFERNRRAKGQGPGAGGD